MMMEPTNLQSYFCPSKAEKQRKAAYQFIGGAGISLFVSLIPASAFLPVSENVSRSIQAGFSFLGFGLSISSIVQSSKVLDTEQYHRATRKAQEKIFYGSLGEVVDTQLLTDELYWEGKRTTLLSQAEQPQLPPEPEPEYQQAEIETEDPLGVIAALSEFNIRASWAGQIDGPAFIRCLVQPAKGIRFSAIAKLDSDLKRAMGLPKPPLIGLSGTAITIDIPRPDRQVVSFSNYIQPGRLSSDTLKIAIGVNLEGKLIEADLSDPNTCHFLIGATTGGGKSELLKAIAASICWRYLPEECQLVFIDPKQVTFPEFENSPWLYAPIARSDEEAIPLLEELVKEMDNRYQNFRETKVSDLSGFNRKNTKKLPRIVVIIDEYANLMGDKKNKTLVEQSIKKLGAMARAAGIHLFVCTQRPEHTIVTPLIRDNLPARIALKTASSGGSEIILGEDDTRALNLLGKGDLLYQANGETVRLQALLVQNWNYLLERAEVKPSTKKSEAGVVASHSAQIPHTPQHKGFTIPHIRTLDDAIALVGDFLANPEERTPLAEGKDREQIQLLFKALIHHQQGKIKTIECLWGVKRGGGSPKYKEAEQLYNVLLAETSGNEVSEFLSKLTSISFPETRLLPAVSGVYFVFDSEYKLYYVGSADNILLRWNSIRYPHHRIPQVQALVKQGKTVKIGWILTSNYEQVEAELVAKYKPEWNGVPIGCK